ncbi:tripartite tricarboxylate transporter permease [Mycobacterium sp. NPDC003449]
MNALDQLFSGFADFASSPQLILLAAAGVLLGTVVGLLPGIGPSTAIALLLPVAMILEPATALILMIALYIGSEFGGRITAILLNMPGDAGALMTTMDGYPLARAGKAGTALTISAISSFVGSIISVIGLVFLAGPLSEFGLAFGPSAYFAVVVMALILSSTLVGESFLRGGIAILLGLLIATMGTDTQAGVPRFTFGISELLNGIDPIIPIVGLFGLGEIYWNLTHSKSGGDELVTVNGGLRPRWKEVWALRWATLRGSLIGFVAGVLPGSGTTMASFFSYSLEKKVSKHPEKFGTGVMEGVASPEAANNSAIGGALVPMFTLGIPGSGTTAVLLAYLTMYGLDPGPSFFSEHGDIAWVVIASMFVSSILALVVNVPLIPAFAKILDIPKQLLFPAIMVLALISGFALNNSVFDALLTLVFGVVGYLMRAARLSPALLVIGLVLGIMLERSFRQAYLLDHGSVFDMLAKPLTLTFLGIAVLAILGDLIRGRLSRRKASAPADQT